jgi:ABC-2 type transport system permease protein
VSAPTSLGWFARHELGLAWRDWTAMMSAGRPARRLTLSLVFGVAVIVLHLIAYAMLGNWAKGGILPNTQTLIWLTGGGLIFFTVMLSQAMESVTRAYYARSDLDLILSSPASAERLFAIRSGAIALTTVALAAFLAGPAINVLIVMDGAQWLGAYLVLIALSAFATAIAILFTATLFRTVGAKRTRLISQIAAAVVGAGFIIGLQVVGILAYGNLSRFSLLNSSLVANLAPGPDSLVWLPAHAAMGNPWALAVVTLFGAVSLLAAISITSPGFARHALAAAGLSQAKSLSRHVRKSFAFSSQKQTLRAKEFKLLLRDPWLLSQSLMQVLYLVPPALMLWLNFGQNSSIFVVVVPVIVMASGQLAGGLAWLAISGEDAHDLVATAPVRPLDVLIAKIQSVSGAIALVVTPLVVLIGLNSLQAALITAIGCALSAGSATAIQLWFRVQAKRSMFRRRQVSSRVATLSEAFVSILWAGTAALALSSGLLAIIPGVLALGVLAFARMLSPKQSLN